MSEVVAHDGRRPYPAATAEQAGTSSAECRAEHGEPYAIEVTLAVWTDRSITIVVGDGTLRPLGRVVADYVEARSDAMGIRSSTA